MPPRTKKCFYQKAGNEPAFDLKAELFRISGVDLTDVPGISAITAHTILTEVGPDLSRFRSASAFTSWLGLCPDNKVSGGNSEIRCVKRRSGTGIASDPKLESIAGTAFSDAQAAAECRGACAGQSNGAHRAEADPQGAEGGAGACARSRC